MAITYTDAEIANPIAERKPLPANWLTLLRPYPKRGHIERNLEVSGEAGHEYRVIIRKNRFNPLDFPVILGVHVPQSNRIFRLRRYNGKSHEHTNQLEREQPFYDFHIHLATQRYQESGNRNPREDGYAEVTDRYGNATGALECLLADANFELAGPQGSMFLAAPEV